MAESKRPAGEGPVTGGLTPINKVPTGKPDERGATPIPKTPPPPGKTKLVRTRLWRPDIDVRSDVGLCDQQDLTAARARMPTLRVARGVDAVVLRGYG